MPEEQQDNPIQNIPDKPVFIDLAQKGQASSLDQTSQVGVQNQSVPVASPSQDLAGQIPISSASHDLTNQNISQEQSNVQNPQGQNKNIPQDELIAYSCIGIGVMFVFVGIALMIV